VLIVAAMVFLPRGITVDSYEPLAHLLTVPLGVAGFYLLIAALAIACFGAASEIALASAYIVAQEFGWNWSENIEPRNAARFSLVYTVVTALAALPTLIGINPLGLTVISMALTAASLPPAVIPFLVIMNDEHYLKDHRNGWLSNAAVIAIMLLSFVLAIVSIPLELMGG
jgi:Mn2+/Fe2+ NRAMP family transporter